MAEDSRFVRDHTASWDSRKGESPDGASDFLNDPTSEAITDIASKLASHGGGPASLDLAVDIYLHDIVERAREATGATGAAIALARGRDVVCRATTGENAPDLGVRVETASGLVGSCLGTGKIQYCRDSETDLQANRESCRQLGVRSMLVIPLGEADEIFGLLEVFSSSPNAFGEKEIAFLRSLAGRVARGITDVRQRANAAPTHERLLPVTRAHEVIEHGGEANDLPKNYSSQKALTTNASELWTTVLFTVVIAAAVTLGIVVGWSGGVKARVNKTSSKPTTIDLSSAQKDQGSPTPAVSSFSPKTAVSGASPTYLGAPPVPDGGLLITQNGKVVYRSGGPTSNGQGQAGLHQADRRLIHRVEPNYPSAARAQHIEGTVVLNAEIRPSGEIGKIVVVSGNSLLADTAVQAVKQWRYEVMPDASQTRISLNFTLPANTLP